MSNHTLEIAEAILDKTDGWDLEIIELASRYKAMSQSISDVKQSMELKSKIPIVFEHRLVELLKLVEE